MIAKSFVALAGAMIALTTTVVFGCAGATDTSTSFDSDPAPSSNNSGSGSGSGSGNNSGSGGGSDAQNNNCSNQLPNLADGCDRPCQSVPGTNILGFWDTAQRAYDLYVANDCEPCYWEAHRQLWNAYASSIDPGAGGFQTLPTNCLDFSSDCLVSYSPVLSQSQIDDCRTRGFFDF